jgi:hypothetical protein
MDIAELLERRKKFPIGSKVTNVNEVDYITSELENNDDVIGLVLPASFLNRKNSDISTLKELIFDDWFVLGIYDLSKIWEPFTGIDFNLICLGKNKPENINFSNYEGSYTFKKDQTHSGVMGEIGKQIITDEYSLYIQELSSIIASHKDKLSKSKGTIFITPSASASFNHEHLSIHYYHPDLIENQNKLDQEKTELLSEVAEILVPRQDVTEECLVFSPANFSYPIQIGKIKKGKKTGIQLRKGDILLSRVGNQKVFLISEELDYELYPSRHTFVIRCKSNSINSEYLFLYLQSDTAKKYVVRHQTGTVINTISRKYLELLPIIIPDKTVVERSINLFKTLFETPKEDTLATINAELFSKSLPKKPIQIEFIEEFIKKSKDYKLGLIKNIVDDDLREIQHCINVQAYKSAIILSGSVLEAILMDWLSEINQKNYLVLDIDLSLFDMIKELDKKGYFDCGITDAAHNIRKQRNLVHPKVYLNSRARIDKKTILKTISELKKVLQMRL